MGRFHWGVIPMITHGWNCPPGCSTSSWECHRKGKPSLQAIACKGCKPLLRHQGKTGRRLHYSTKVKSRMANCMVSTIAFCLGKRHWRPNKGETWRLQWLWKCLDADKRAKRTIWPLVRYLTAPNYPTKTAETFERAKVQEQIDQEKPLAW